MIDQTNGPVNTPTGLRVGDQQKRRARNRTSAQRTAARNRSNSYLTSIAVEDFNRAEQERERLALLDHINGVRDTGAELPLLSLMVAIAGYLNWFMISGHPVEISRHTSESVRGRCMTAKVMAHIGA